MPETEINTARTSSPGFSAQQSSSKTKGNVSKESSSTSTTINSVDSQVKRISKRRHNDEKPDDQCAKCGCRLLRVVDNGRPDNRRILECMRRDCLATLNFTDLPVGTVIGAESFKPSCYYQDPVRIFYPNKEDIEETLKQIKSEPNELFTSVFENDRGTLLVSVPGQLHKARLL